MEYGLIPVDPKKITLDKNLMEDERLRIIYDVKDLIEKNPNKSINIKQLSRELKLSWPTTNKYYQESAELLRQERLDNIEGIKSIFMKGINSHSQKLIDKGDDVTIEDLRSLMSFLKDFQDWDRLSKEPINSLDDAKKIASININNNTFEVSPTVMKEIEILRQAEKKENITEEVPNIIVQEQALPEQNEETTQ